MLKWTIRPLRLELKYNWVISRNTSAYKPNFVIQVEDEKQVYGLGEVAPNIRYGETPEIIEDSFSTFQKNVGTNYSNLLDFSTFLDTLSLPHALRFGIESAFAHYLCHANGLNIYQLLQIQPPASVFTCYSIPIIAPESIQEFFSVNNLSRFSSIKLKINKDTGYESLKSLSGIFNGAIYLDPNESFTDADELLSFLDKVKHLPIAFVEQPLPSHCVNDYVYARSKSPFPLIADESVTDNADMQEIANQFHGVNMKLMKAGGYLKGLEILQKARKTNLKTMIGCMIESSLGISSAWHLCNGVNFIDLDGFMIVKDEPFGYLSEQKGEITLNKV